MSANIREIVNILEKLAPKSYAYQWDNVGLQVGSQNKNISRILTTLEVTDAILEEAIEKKVDLIITHHPMIFSPLKSIIKESMKGNLVYKAIQNNINIYAMHTNIDVALGGLNDHIAGQLNIQDIQVLDETQSETYYKLVVFVPVGYEETVAEAMSKAGAGHIGNYSHCTFRIEGTGTFKPLDGANPFIGSQGNLEKLEEIRLETIVLRDQLKKVMDALIEAHPYEEVAYDIYPLENQGPALGIGRIGRLEGPQALKDFIEEVKKKLNLESVRVAGDLDATIERVAIINGSGADLISSAIVKGCQCVITGDVKYHDAQDAISQGINVIDVGHYHSEKFFAAFIKEYLEGEVKKKGWDIAVVESTINLDPFKVL